MRGVVFAVLTATALLLGSVGAVGAVPAQNANCVAGFVTLFEPGSLGPVLSGYAPGGAWGAVVGGQGSGAAPTNCGQ